VDGRNHCKSIGGL